MMLLKEENDVGVQNLAVYLPIDRIICDGRKNPPLCQVDCIGCFIACFDVRFLREFLFDFKKPQEFQKQLEKIFQMALVPFF